MNDLPSVVKFSSVESDVDNTKVYLSCSSENIDSCLAKVSEDLRLISSWCCTNKLLINPDKTKHILFGTKQLLSKVHDIRVPFLAVRNSLIATTETPSRGSSRSLALHMKTLAGFVNIISAYAPTLTSTPEAKDQFFEALQETLSGIPSSEGIKLFGDLNAHVETDWQALPTCLGHFSIGRMNENAQRLLKLCCHHGLCFTKSYFKYKELHKVSWRHPLSRDWHQLDPVITRRADVNSFLHTKSYHSADCDADHSLVASKVRLKPRKIHHSKTKGCPPPPINTCSTSLR